MILTKYRDGYWIDHPDRDHKAVTLGKLGHNFKTQSQDRVFLELDRLRKTEGALSDIKGTTNVDRIVYYKRNK